MRQLSKEFSVPEEEIKKLVGKKAANLTYEERKKRNQLILDEFIQNPERCQEGRLRSFCEELGARYNLSWRQVQRIYKKREKEILEQRTSTTEREIVVASFDASPHVQKWVKMLRRGENGRKCRASTIDSLVSCLRRLFEDYALVGEPNTDPRYWDYEKVSDLLEMYEEGKKEIYNYIGAYNSFVKRLELDKKTFRRSIVTNGTYRPGRIKGKKPLDSKDVKRVLEECFNLYGSSRDDVRFFERILPENYSSDELEDLLAKEILKNKEYTSRDYKFWKKYKGKTYELETRFGIKVSIINKNMRKIEKECMDLKRRLKNARRSMNLYCILKMMTISGMRHGSREKRVKTTAGERIVKRAHGLAGLRFRNWDFSREQWRYSVSEKWHDWINKGITEDVQRSLATYFRLLSKEERALDNYCFSLAKLDKCFVSLTERCKLGEYKRGWYTLEKVHGRRGKLHKECSENTPGARYGMLKNEDGDYVMLWGRHLHAHLLRASFANICRNELGMRLEEIAMLGGWKNLQTLWERYIVVDEEEMYRHLRKLEKVTYLDEGF
ncbi:MAG: hypothetical protein ACTSRW_16045 [Candidatus Helarchaeota archaeon]